MLVSRTVQAQNKENDSAPKRWEYCSVVPLNGISTDFGKSTGTVMIYYARDAESNPEKVQGVVKNNSMDSVIVKAVAKLGIEGWEMIGEGTFLSYTGSEQKTLYFKRPVR